MILLNINKDTEKPLYLDIAYQLKELIDNGTLSPGERLPSTREMSEKLEVNRSTLCRAYEELWVTGYIESTPGSYTYVRKRKLKAGKQARYKNSIINWDEVTDISFNTQYTENPVRLENLKDYPDDCIKMKSVIPDERLYPVKEFKSAFNGAIKKHSSKIFTYTDSKGYLPLRSFLCKRLQKHGINAVEDEVIITSGSQNSIDLIFRLLLGENQGVACESPTYFHIYPLLKMKNARVTGVPIQDDGKYDFSELRKGEKPVLFYTTPNFQNPTGLTMSQEDREELLSICEDRKIPILEDGFEEEMKYFGKFPLSIKSLDKKKIVLYLGSISKVLFPGLRIGWIVADKDFIDRLALLKSYSDLSGSLITQAAFHEFCIRDYYDLHIKKLNRIYRKRMQILLENLYEEIRNENVTWTKPLGGYTLMMELKNLGMTIEEANEVFLNNGVALLPGNHFYFYPTKKKNFRISIASLDEIEIQEGVQRIKNSLKEIYS